MHNSFVGQQLADAKPRKMRADAQRKLASVVEAATQVFAKSGVDAPVREIAERAGVGLGTVYRHFPQRSDLIVAVFQTQVNACAEAAAVLMSQHAPAEALARWMQRFVDFVATKRGLAAALHSGDTAYTALPDYFNKHLEPALKMLLDAAIEAKAARSDIAARDLLLAVGTLCQSSQDDGLLFARKMTQVLIDGMRS